MDVFKDQWEKQVRVLTEAVDDITSVDDFLSVSGNQKQASQKAAEGEQEYPANVMSLCFKCSSWPFELSIISANVTVASS